MGKYVNLYNKRRKNYIYSVLDGLGFQNTFSNYRTSIWENESAHISVDKKVTRILLYDGTRKDLVDKIKCYL